jgi:polar amino acid transport system substrate-binding protein
VSRRRSRLLAAVTVLAAGLGVAACTTAGQYDPTPLYTAPATPSSSRSPYASPSPSSTATAPAPASARPGTDVAAANCLRSYAPPRSMPPPGRMPAGSYMSKIQERGRLKAGVSADSLLLGARNPITGRIEGFDIDMLHAVSQALFGRPDRIDFTVITSAQAQKEKVLRDGTVDIVARNMTITCERWTKIAFSTEYYRSGQKILVRKGERTARGGSIRRIEDLAGRRVCAPEGTTAMTTLQSVPTIQPVGADTHTGCLVLFQQGAVDAIIGDATVLAGLAAQDPYAMVVRAPSFTVEPYGLGIKAEHIDFVRFVNGVLEQMRADGRLTRSYDRWLAGALGKAPPPPQPVYGRSP